jgi:hypothetical protein
MGKIRYEWTVGLWNLGNVSKTICFFSYVGGKLPH